MSILIEYSCNCSYYHGDDDSITMVHVCTDHKIQIYKDAFANYSKRVKLGTST